jgi:hypothetical protein
MKLEARITPIWKKQKLFVAIFLILFGAYFFWDGFIGWPRSNERFLKHKEFTDAGNPEGWAAYAKERGWKVQPPEKFYKQGDIIGQYVFGSLCTVAGAAMLLYWLQQIRRRLCMDAEAVTSPAGIRVPFSAITGLGLKKWDSKGLATVRYEIDGQRGEFIVDDYKFDTEPTRQMLEEIKRRLEERAAPAKEA